MSEINEDKCNTDLKPTGSSGCASDLTIAAKLFLFKEGVNFASITAAETEATLDGLIQDGDCFPFPLLHNAENSDKEGAIDEGSTGQSHKVSDGTGQNTYYVITTAEMHSRLRSFDQFTGGYMVVDKNKNCKCYTPDGISVDPLTIGTCGVGIQIPATESTAAYTPIFISDKYPREWNNSPAVFKPDWNILGKNGLLPVRLTIVGDPTATSIVVNATVYNTGAAVSGLEAHATDWVVENGSTSGASESETTLGQYTIAGTGFATGTIDLGDSSVLGVTGYASDGAASFTIATE